MSTSYPLSARDERVLILCPTGRDAEVMSDSLRRAGLSVEVCSDFAALRKNVQEGAGALLIAEEALDDAQLDALDSMLAAQPSWSDIVVVLMTPPAAHGTARAALFEKLTGGNFTFVERPTAAPTLVSLLKSALRARRRQYETRDLVDSLRQAEMRFRALVTASSETMYRISPDWSELRQVTSRSIPAENIQPSRTWLEDYIHPDDRDRVKAATGEALRTKTPYQLEHRLRRPDGILTWVHSRAVPLVDPQGEILEWFGAATDITERKEREAERERVLDDLERAQEIAKRDLEAMTRLRRISSLFLHGGNPDSVLGEIVEAAMAIAGADYGMLERVAPESAAMNVAAQRGFPEWWVDSWANEMAGREPCRAALEKGERVVIEDVEKTPASMPRIRELLLSAGVRAVQATPLIGRAGKLLGTFCTHWKKPWFRDERVLHLLDLLGRQAADIIERAEAEDALLVANERLVETDRRKNEFINMLSHELRNPLAPIGSSVHILGRAAPGSDQANRARLIIERQVRHLSRLVDDLLDVTRISRGKIRLQLERVELNGLLTRAAEDLRSLFVAGAIDLALDVPETPVYARGDPVRLAQALGNLLNNAAKFTPAGGRTLVALEKTANQRARIRVRDNGTGIAADILPTIFDPFVQAETTLDRSHSGLGLGLALVRGLMELHGGSVWAHSDGLGKGAEFVLELPTEELAERYPERAPGFGARNPARRILIIEDNADAAASLKEALELNGHEVALAHSGREGVDKARGFGPDVVLCDIGLPGMDGYDVARTFRGDDQLHSTFLAALSGYAQPEDVERAKEAGFNEHMAKPLDLGALERMLSAAAP